ncbi:MAG: hypothetical protein HPY90_15630 [Syntrophothermus sp.]|uniref:hypothetical protein n=1 Tax=Syntrophothermus sp. TaxID=2736299 RepID=UPI00257D3D1C|nr:hypothetical protein [Syntrophothermus sp.]NSW84624.1 hypothetical protein [Syntrophothermus sp.]
MEPVPHQCGNREPETYCPHGIRRRQALQVRPRRRCPAGPFIQEKSMKLIPEDVARVMLGESPIMVAARCTLADTATPNQKRNGGMFGFSDTPRATGAMIRTVATFSTNTEINPDRALTESSSRVKRSFMIEKPYRSGPFDRKDLRPLSQEGLQVEGLVA